MLLLALLSCCLTLGMARHTAAQAQGTNTVITSAAGGSRFGVVEGFWMPGDACELGAGWERIIFDWEQHQPTGPDDWNTLNVDDRWLKAASDCGREVVAIFKHTPAWATDGVPRAGVPRGLYLPVDDPDNLWANFVRRTAAYYASRGVYRFIIWNEPDITPDTYGFAFEGTLDDYFQMLKVAYLAARQGNPQAQIHIAGMTYWHDVNAGRRLYLDRLLERILQDPAATANEYYFHAISLHVYFRTETVYSIVSEMRDLLARYDLSAKAIWINETNVSPNLDPLWLVERPQFQMDLEQQANFIVQAAGLGLAAGAERIAVYKLIDQGLPPGAEAFGLLRPDGSRRPAFYAWQTVIRQFSDVTAAQFAQSEHLDAVLLTHASGRQTLLLWARDDSPAQAQISATDDKAYLLDVYGNMRIVRPVDAVYSLALPGATCRGDAEGCPVGGAVWMLVQPAGSSSVQDTTADAATPLVFE